MRYLPLENNIPNNNSQKRNNFPTGNNIHYRIFLNPTGMIFPIGKSFSVGI